MDVYIRDQRFWRRDPRFHNGHRQRQRRSDRLILADFEYQEERDEYHCAKGRVFRLQVKRVVQDGTICRRYSHKGEGCQEGQHPMDNIQWLLYCMVHNIGKIMNYGSVDPDSHEPSGTPPSGRPFASLLPGNLGQRTDHRTDTSSPRMISPPL